MGDAVVADEPKKQPKKLKIIDANEPADEKPVADDVPKVEEPAAPQDDTDDAAAINDAFADAKDDTNEVEEPEVEVEQAEEPAAKTPKKIAILAHEEVDEPAAIIEDKAPEESENEVAEPKADVEETAAQGEASEEVPVDEPNIQIADDEVAVEEAPTAPELPKEKPLSQLTNNIPRPKAEEPLSEGPVEDETEFADPTTAKAVDDIVEKESDEVLALEDAEANKTEEVAPKKRRGIKGFFKAWWGNPAARWGTIAGLFILLVLIGLLPATRYAILNAAGVRATSSLTVISNDSQQPLKNATVSLGGQSATTDGQGTAHFTKLRLGKTDLLITKRGFASVQRSYVLGLGSNPLGSIGMTVTGTRLVFIAKDFLSNKGIMGAEVSTGDYNAQTDTNGKAVLSVDQNAAADLTVTIKANGYRDEKVSVKLTETGEKSVLMAPSQSHVFVSRRSGKLDIYKVDADGKNEAVLLAATGKERDDIALLQQPNGDYTAVVSTREGAHNSSGFLLSNFYILNNKSGQLTKFNQSEHIQLVDWTGDRIIFTAVTEGASAANPNRSKLFSYQIGQPGAKQIASANYFNDVAIFKGALYFAPSSYAVPVSSVKFYRVNPDGSNQSTLLSSEVWNIFRSDYDTLQLSVQQDWYEYKGTASPTKLTTAPANPRTRVYRDSPDGKQSLWVDSRDGKGVLLSYDTTTKKDTTLLSQSGLTYPVYWLNDSTYVYRINDGHETADYVRSTQGGDAKKLRDVTNTNSTNYFN